MKKIIFAVLSFVSLYSEPTGALLASVAPSESYGYFILADGTFWKVATFVKRWRSPIEWISGAELQVPESYISKITDWVYNDEFEVCLKYGNLRADESAASNQEELQHYTHLMMNPRTGKVLFALPLHPADFATQLYSEGRSAGHAAGYSEGYLVGYDAGYATGKSAEAAFDK